MIDIFSLSLNDGASGPEEPLAATRSSFKLKYRARIPEVMVCAGLPTCNALTAVQSLYLFDLLYLKSHQPTAAVFLDPFAQELQH